MTWGTVLLSGGAGFVGSNLVKLLLQAVEVLRHSQVKVGQ